jgi:hypothetical protein
MSHDVKKMIYVGEVPWYGLGVRLLARASYEEIVQAAGFYQAVEQDVFVPPNPRPVPDRKALVRGDTGQYLAVVGKNVATRVVCANTLGVALGEREGATWKIQHTANARERLEEAGKAFRQMVRSYEKLGELANVFASTPFTDKQMKATVDLVMPIPLDDGDHRRLETEREKVVQLFGTAIGIEKLRSTAWAAFQGWTEYADHHRLARNTGRQDPRKARLESIWMGRSAAMKQAALQAITSQVGIHLAAA